MRTAAPINMEVTHFEKKLGTTSKLIPPLSVWQKKKKVISKEIGRKFKKKHEVSSFFLNNLFQLPTS